MMNWREDCLQNTKNCVILRKHLMTKWEKGIKISKVKEEEIQAKK